MIQRTEPCIDFEGSGCIVTTLEVVRYVELRHLRRTGVACASLCIEQLIFPVQCGAPQRLRAPSLLTFALAALLSAFEGIQAFMG